MAEVGKTTSTLFPAHTHTQDTRAHNLCSVLPVHTQCSLIRAYTAHTQPHAHFCEKQFRLSFLKDMHAHFVKQSRARTDSHRHRVFEKYKHTHTHKHTRTHRHTLVVDCFVSHAHLTHAPSGHTHAHTHTYTSTFSPFYPLLPRLPRSIHLSVGGACAIREDRVFLMYENLCYCSPGEQTPRKTSEA